MADCVGACSRSGEGLNTSLTGIGHWEGPGATNSSRTTWEDDASDDGIQGVFSPVNIITGEENNVMGTTDASWGSSNTTEGSQEGANMGDWWRAGPDVVDRY